MNTSWWRKLNQLDHAQLKFMELPLEGRYILSGPPGSGKTNLLLLRAEVMIGSGEQNILFITYTNTLADFIRSGAITRGLIKGHQIKTYHSWAAEHVLGVLGQRILPKDSDFDDTAREQSLELVLEANKKRPSKFMYSAIFVDEAQDLTTGELSALLELSDKICICGDGRQGIYHRDGMESPASLALTPHILEKHFRIGPAIARVADRLMPPMEADQSLELTCNYDSAVQGASSANIFEYSSRDEQFEEMMKLIRVQCIAFKGENIGVFCPKKETRQELREKFNSTELSENVFVHGVDDNASFTAEKQIHVLTLHGSKGTEFKCVHIFGAEDLNKFPLNRTKLSYTGVTRAKTALNVFKTGATNVNMENAFAKPKLFGIENLLDAE